MNQLGNHIIMDLYGCDADKLDDVDYIRDALEKAAAAAGATIVQTVMHRYLPQGITGICLVQESHLSIHTWPEYEFVAVDIFMCGKEGDPEKALDYLQNVLGGKDRQVQKMVRGKLPASMETDIQK